MNHESRSTAVFAALAGLLAAALLAGCSEAGGGAGTAGLPEDAGAEGVGSAVETPPVSLSMTKRGWELVREECSECHGTEQIEAARKDWAGWVDALEHMADNGLALAEAERDAVVAYLATRELVDVRGAQLVEEKCTTCHLLDRLESARKDWDGWGTAVGHMVDYGARISPLERDIVIEYLALRQAE